MTAEEIRSLKPGDYVYFKHPKYGYEAIYEITAVDPNSFYILPNCRIVHKFQSENQKNDLVDFILYDNFTHKEFLTKIDKTNYPEYFI